MFTLPVKSCISSKLSPNLFEPDVYNTEELTVVKCISLAVNVPVILTSELIVTFVPSSLMFESINVVVAPV